MLGISQVATKNSFMEKRLVKDRLKVIPVLSFDKSLAKLGLAVVKP